MKKQILTLCSILMLNVMLFAGGGFTGKIVYSMDYDLPEAYEAQRAMLATEMTVYIGKGFTRTEQKTGLGDQIVITNLKTKITTILMNLMGQKIAISSEDTKGNETKKHIEITSETKTIAGYECKKAIYTLVADNEENSQTVEIYFTDQLPKESNSQFPGIEGYPLEYIIETQGMTITYKAKSVTEAIVDKNLSKIPDGYQKMTTEEFGKMMGAE
jgi:GLPGLI family protein